MLHAEFHSRFEQILPTHFLIWRDDHFQPYKAQLFRTDILCCMQSFRADPDKSFRPISLFGETVVLSHIAADFVGGILWGASSASGGAQTPRGPDLVPQRPDSRSDTHPFQSRGQGTSFGAVSSVFRRSELPDEFSS